MSKHPSSSFSIEAIIGFNNIDKNTFNSCLFIKDEINFPKKVESCINSSIEAEFIGVISCSNSLYIKINNSSCSGFGIKILS